MDSKRFLHLSDFEDCPFVQFFNLTAMCSHVDASSYSAIGMPLMPASSPVARWVSVVGSVPAVVARFVSANVTFGLAQKKSNTLMVKGRRIQ